MPINHVGLNRLRCAGLLSADGCCFLVVDGAWRANICPDQMNLRLSPTRTKRLGKFFHGWGANICATCQDWCQKDVSGEEDNCFLQPGYWLPSFPGAVKSYLLCHMVLRWRQSAQRQFRHANSPTQAATSMQQKSLKLHAKEEGVMVKPIPQNTPTLWIRTAGSIYGTNQGPQNRWMKGKDQGQPG